MQRRFLRALGFPEIEALEQFRLAPLPCRRDMAMLGALHRITLGDAPSQLAELFHIVRTFPEPLLARRIRGWKPRHTCFVLCLQTKFKQSMMALADHIIQHLGLEMEAWAGHRKATGGLCS